MGYARFRVRSNQIKSSGTKYTDYIDTPYQSCPLSCKSKIKSRQIEPSAEI
jgi:hypothetical protein